MAFEYVGEDTNDPGIKRFEKMTLDETKEIVKTFSNAQTVWVKNLPRDSHQLSQLNSLETVMAAKAYIHEVLSDEIYTFIGEEKVVDLGLMLITLGMFIISEDEHVKF